jgi:hypothetical protein
MRIHRCDQPQEPNSSIGPCTSGRGARLVSKIRSPSLTPPAPAGAFSFGRLNWQLLLPVLNQAGCRLTPKLTLSRRAVVSVIGVKADIATWPHRGSY